VKYDLLSADCPPQQTPASPLHVWLVCCSHGIIDVEQYAVI
jgi:hypothetical protein